MNGPLVPRYEPMLAGTRKEPFHDPAWTFEVKWDGVRLLLSWDGPAVALHSRRGTEVSSTYPELAGFRAPGRGVLDGEVIALDDSGRPSFQRLQQRMNVTDGRRAAALVAEVPIAFVLFDLLHDGEELIGMPIEERRRRLRALTLPRPCVVADVFEDGLDLWHIVDGRRLEGMVAKRRGSFYRPGIRSADWLKIARRPTGRFVVGGYQAGEGGRAGTFGSILLGVWDGAGLAWVGSVGSGFDDRTLRAVKSALDELARADCPFRPDPALPARAHWVEPVLVAAVEYKEWTEGGRLRAPVFKGFTGDDPATVTREAELP